MYAATTINTHTCLSIIVRLVIHVHSPQPVDCFLLWSLDYYSTGSWRRCSSTWVA
ncbi:hypothetical protein LINPERHAP1_LOCUS17245, partial [Linum perenne]